MLIYIYIYMLQLSLIWLGKIVTLKKYYRFVLKETDRGHN